LASKSLVRRAENGRYDQHELVRQYASEQLHATDEIEQVRQRHVTFFTELAEAARQEIEGPQVTAWLDRLEHDNDNLRAALDCSIARQASQMALRLGAAMWRFWEYRGYVDEGRRWLKAVLALPGSDGDDDALQRTKVLNGAGSLARIQGDFAQARSLHEESLAIRRKVGDLKGIAASLNSLGVLAMFESQYALAETLLEESLQLCCELGIQTEVVKRLNNLGVVAMYQGDYERSRLLHEQALAVYRELNDQHGMAGSLGNLGDVLRYQGHYDRARQVLEQSLVILSDIGDVHGLAITLGSLARVHLATGDVDQAVATFGSSLMRSREVGDKTEIATGLEGVAAALVVHAERSAAPVWRYDCWPPPISCAGWSDRFARRLNALKSIA